jgi:hypothetical protein
LATLQALLACLAPPRHRSSVHPLHRLLVHQLRLVVGCSVNNRLAHSSLPGEEGSLVQDPPCLGRRNPNHLAPCSQQRLPGPSLLRLRPLLPCSAPVPRRSSAHQLLSSRALLCLATPPCLPGQLVSPQHRRLRRLQFLARHHMAHCQSCPRSQR